MNRIKELRQKNNLTLRGLGDKVNMSSSRISQYETGKREPKLETWNKLAEYFNVPTFYLMGLNRNDLKFPTKQEAGFTGNMIAKLNFDQRADVSRKYLPELERRLGL